MSEARFRVLLVPESVHWVTGTIAKSIARFNPEIEATIASGPVIDSVLNEYPELIRNFDLVHFTCPYASRQWLPRLHDQIPCVTSHHHVTDWDAIKHNLEGDAIIVGSPEWADDLRVRGVDVSKVICIPYGVNAEQFCPGTEAERLAIRRRLRTPTEAIVIGFFGKASSNDDDRKGIDVFTRAILSLKQSKLALTVLIVGPGWHDLVDSFKLAGVRCIWFPFIRDSGGLADMYRALDFYWVTARVEGGPVTLLEAMSSEVCCLTTRVGLARAIIRDGHNGILLPFNNSEAFAERTIALASEATERRRIGRNARETILREMHVANTARRVREVYAKAVERFANRRDGVLPLKVREVAANVPAVTFRSDVNIDVPLSGFPRAIHQRVRMLENLAWSEHLIVYHRQRAVALQIIVKEWLQNPLSLLPARVLLRRFLPTSIVAQLVKLKNRRQL